MRKFATLFLALLTLGFSFAEAAAQSRYPGAYGESRYSRDRYADYGRGYRPRYDEPRHYGRPRHYRRDNSGAIGAGILALALGAAVVGALANQAQAAPPPPATTDPQLAAYCARRFRSYDPMTGTYLTGAGERMVCTY
ncbi:BA14K family protein [Microvirga sp. VF16]|uniref:BA14K family protein n=1 Tax=Microvirga sp. VF16 TaxID=2807101 RepID=UPI00193D92A3|nr:BA14K family protein [Microvirga sp. VF16]QRM34939.1 BA14K family protein [Microvirga sp. VF16]